MEVDINIIKKILSEALIELKATQRHDAFTNGKIEALELLMIALSKLQTREELDMLRSKLVKEVVKLDDLPQRSRHSEIEDELKAIAAGLKRGEAALINGAEIKWGHFSSKVYAMIEDKKLDADFKPRKRGDKFYLARLAA